MLTRGIPGANSYASPVEDAENVQDGSQARVKPADPSRLLSELLVTPPNGTRLSCGAG